jgi:hypothetical protein
MQLGRGINMDDIFLKTYAQVRRWRGCALALGNARAGRCSVTRPRDGARVADGIQGHRGNARVRHGHGALRGNLRPRGRGVLRNVRGVFFFFFFFFF